MPVPRRDLVVVALPTGVHTSANGTFGTVSAYFAPRLREDGTLGDYPDWKQWPNALRRLNLRVEADGVIVNTQIRSQSSNRLWRAVLPPSTTVRFHTYTDRTKQEFRSYPGGVVASRIDDLYAAVASGFPDDPPTADDLAGLPEAAALFEAAEFGAAEGFHDEVTEHATADVPLPSFHEWLTLLSPHPALLRALGIVVDLAFPLGPLGGMPPTRVRVRTDYNLPNTRQANPITRCSAMFRPEVGDEVIVGAAFNELEDGFLKVTSADSVGLHQVNLGEATVRLGAVDRLPATAEPRPGSGALPQLQSTGVALVRNNQVDKFDARLHRQDEIEDDIEDQLNGQAPTVDLVAEDITTGFRFDVWDDLSHEWHTLSARRPTGPYRFPRGKKIDFTPPDDEGIHTWTLVSEGFEDSAVVIEDPENPHPREVKTGLRRIDPSLFTWTGWSAVTPRPSHHLDLEAGIVPTEASEPDTTQDVQLAIDHQPVPGTLPSLRFGRTYRMRARAVDLAGNSVRFEHGDVQGSSGATEDEFFGRVERVAAPRILRRRPQPVPGVGETPLTIVLRSDYDIDDTKVEGDDRILFPPAVTQFLCELHGLPAGGVDPGSYADLVARDRATIEDDTVPDPVTDEPLWASVSKDVYSPSPPAAVAYLPDPASGGIALSGLPGTKGPLEAGWKGGFPAVPSGLLEIVAGTAPPDVQPVPEVFFRLSAPKAFDELIRLSCTIDPSGVALFDSLQGADPALLERVRAGQHWMFSQGIDVRIVHAVRRPLSYPVIGAAGGALAEPLTVSRRPGATDCDIAGPVLLDGGSTGAVTLLGSWEEPVDDGVDPTGPATLPERRRQFTQSGLAVDEDNPDVAGSFELGTTKRLDLTVAAEATSRFVGYFAEQTEFTFSSEDPVVLDPAGVVASTVQVRDDGRLVRRDVDYLLDGAAGTLQRLPGGSLNEFSQVNVRYVARPVSRSSTEDPGGGSVEVVVPASVAPPAPVVVDVVPAFAVSERIVGKTFERTRDGRVLRVWCGRPWLVSGDFERLAVVLPGGGEAGTVWARDPGQAAAGPGSPLEDWALPWASIVEPAEPGGPVVAAHDAVFDADQARWYAEVLVDGDTGYRPWIQPALARHQVDAVPGAHLSGVVYPGPVRLGARRVYSWTVAAGSPKPITVTMQGDDHAGVPDGTGGMAFNECTVTIQQRDMGVDDADLGWFDTGQVETMTRSGLGSWTLTFSIAGSEGDEFRLVLTETEPTLTEETGATALARIVSNVEVIVVPPGFVTTT